MWSVILKRGPACGYDGGAWVSVKSGTLVIFKYDSSLHISSISLKIKRKLLNIGNPFWPISTALHLFIEVLLHICYMSDSVVGSENIVENRKYLSSGRLGG